MAKQDLVVKLLLDSGAFGNDLRQAERKAQDFKNNLQGAGKSAGEFSKAIGLSTGALGKLGGVLGGAGAVVAGVEAFKSVMESTHTTAKEFSGTIEGFQGILTTLQQSLATFDFSAFRNGLTGTMGLFQQFRNLNDSFMESERGGVAFSLLSKKYEAQIKQLKTDFVKSNDETEKKTLKELAQGIISDWRETFEDYENIVNDFINNKIIAGSGLKADLININKVKEQIDIWARNENDPLAEQKDKEEYERLAKERSRWERIKGNAEGNLKTVISYEDYQRYTKQLNQAEAEINRLDEQILDVGIRNQLYKMPTEELDTFIKQLNEVVELGKKIDDQDVEIQGWVTAVSGTTTSTKTTTTSTKKPEIKDTPIVGSLAELQNTITATKKIMTNYIDKDSEEFKVLAEDLREYNEELERYNNIINGIGEGGITPYDYNMGLLDEGNALLSKRYDKKLLQDIENKINDITAELPNLHTYLDDLPLNTDEWRKTLGVLSEYYVMLEKLKEKYKEVKLEEKNQIKFENLNVSLSSTTSLLNGVSGLLSTIDSESAKMASNVIGVFSNITDGIMNFIQVQQAAAAATGVSSAAAMPFPYNLAAIASVMGTVLSVFANIKSMVSGKFADGGIVGGTSYTGDKLFAMVNSGEMILNKRQQNNLANMLGGGGQVEFVISGDNLVGVLNNRNNKRNLTR